MSKKIKSKKVKNKKIKIVPKTIEFEDYPDFTPNLTPEQMFRLGSFGGTYWRPIYSSITKKNYKDQHLEFPKSWWEGIPKNWLVTDFEDYDVSINKYKVQVGTTLEFWENKDWIDDLDPYGWVQWYCRFYSGRRDEKEDKRQIKRWKNLAGKKGRFKNMLINMIKKKDAKYNDYTISPKIRQTLQHWAYKITKEDLKQKEDLK